jgi:hypothetical protein
MELHEKLKHLIHRLYNDYTDNQLGMSAMYAEIAGGLEECSEELQKLIKMAKDRSEEWDTISHT